ncbi:MAG: hypothetical protein HUU18_12425 [Phycisphaerales bacterium]|nr:hypothetical protein [Phycisphaerales bacterium]
MNTHQLIDAALGFLLLVVGLSQLLHRRAWATTFVPLLRHSATPILAGLYALMFGLVIAAAHNVWGGWSLVTTLLGWWLILFGAAFLLAPGATGRWLARLVITPNLMLLGGVIRLTLGLVIGLGIWLTHVVD